MGWAQPQWSAVCTCNSLELQPRSCSSYNLWQSSKHSQFQIFSVSDSRLWVECMVALPSGMWLQFHFPSLGPPFFLQCRNDTNSQWPTGSIWILHYKYTKTPMVTLTSKLRWLIEDRVDVHNSEHLQYYSTDLTTSKINAEADAGSRYPFCFLHLDLREHHPIWGWGCLLRSENEKMLITLVPHVLYPSIAVEAM